MTKKAIFFRGPSGSGKDLSATIANNYIHKSGIKSTHCRFDSSFDDSICRMFGLAHTAAYYLKDRNNEPCDEFFGRSPSTVFGDILRTAETYQPGFLGVAAARRIVRETQYNTFVFSDWPNDRSALAVANAIGPDNCLIVSITGRGRCDDFDPSTELALMRCHYKIIKNDDDKEMLTLFVKGTIKGWLGIDE